MRAVRRALRRLVSLLLAFLFILVLVNVAPKLLRWLYPLSHQQVIVREARLRRVDPSLVAAVINVESRWQANAVSPKGAAGLMQLMPSTADWVAEQMGLSAFQQQELFSPEVNIRLGTWYLANLLKEFGQELPVAVAAYNGGRGNVEGWLTQGIWDGTLEDAGSIPFEETRRYVRKVLQQQLIYRSLYQWDNFD
ncbi:MAG: lytic transglycosylase domain-containing protein [Bacillota bacterium]|jgi:soluble lytic murein transglycosylase